MKVGPISKDVEIRKFEPSILNKFKGRKIVLSAGALRAKSWEAIKWENKSLCSRLIKTIKSKKCAL